MSRLTVTGKKACVFCMQPECHLVANGNAGVKVQADYYRSCRGAVGIPEVPTPDNIKRVLGCMVPCVCWDGVRFFDNCDNVVLDIFGS